MTGDSHSRRARVLLLAYPALLVVGGIRLWLRTPLDFSSGPTESSSVPMWALSLDFVLLGVPFVVLGLWTARQVWLRTKQQFRIDVFHAPLGFFGALPTIAALFLAPVNPHSMFSYNWNSPGGFEGGLYSMMTTVILAAVWAAISSVFVFLYVSGIVDEGSGKYDKRPDETDGVAQLIEQMKSREV